MTEDKGFLQNLQDLPASKQANKDDEIAIKDMEIYKKVEEIHMEDGPSYFEKKIKSLTHSKINDDQTKMSWTNDFCGEITVSFWKNQADPDPLCTASRGETSCIMNLEPCKTYTMDVSLNIAGNEDTYYDLPQELELTTQPSQAQLDQVFGENSVTNGVVNWDFSRVMDDLSYSCIGRFSYSLQDGDGMAVQGNTGTDIVPGRDEKPIVRVNTTSQLQCGGQLVMKVSYSLEGEEDVIEVDSDNEEEDSPLRSSFGRSRSSSVLADKYELCEFPPGEKKTKDSVTVCVQDYKSLEYDTFLNDIIIDFYLTYLFYEKLPAEDRSSVHIFSTMFYKRLTNSYKNDVTGLNSAEKKHARVKAWTKNVNLFEKKILVFPICYQNHWFLIIAVR